MHRSLGGAGPARRRAAAIALAAVLAGIALPAGAEPDDGSAQHLRVGFRDGLLTVEAHDAPIGGVLQAVGEAAGMEVPRVLDLGETFTGDFSALSLADGLRRLLRARSYTLRYDEAGNPERLVLLPTGKARVQPARAAVAPADAVLGAQASPAQEEGWIAQRLTSADLGTRIVAVRRLDRLPPERATAVGLRVFYSEPEPVVRAQLAATLGRVEGDGVVTALEQLLRDRDLSVRMAAVEALGRSASDAAAHGLGRILLYENDRTLRQAALRSLASHPGQSARDYLRLMATRNGDPMADAARQSLAGATVPAATEDVGGASPCLHAAGRRPGACRKD